MSLLLSVRCPTTQLDNGVLEYRDIDSMVTLEPKHNDFRIATCNTGYDLQGVEETRCLVGAWEDELPICLEGEIILAFYKHCLNIVLRPVPFSMYIIVLFQVETYSRGCSQ